jgi:hypothetical protein
MTASAGQNAPAPDLLVLLHERADALPPARLTLADRMRVAFAGSRGGEGPLTISQDTTLSWVTNPAFPTRMVEWSLSLPRGTTLSDIAAALRILMSRHEALRTCYPPGPGEPVQRVIKSGELVVEVYAASDEPADDAVLVIEFTRLLRAREFDLAADLPLRVAVAAWQDRPRALVILFSHMAADMAAMVQLSREFTTLVRDPSSREVGPPRFQPLDLAEQEHSARGRRRHDTAVRNWEAIFLAMPQCLYAVPSADPGRDGGVVSGWLWSRAGALALGRVTARTSASRQSVVFAALCTVIGWRTGHDTCVLPVIASNRYQRNLREYIGTLVQDGITSLNVRARSFDEVVRRAAAATLRGNHSSLISVRSLARATQEAEHRRGIIRERYCTFNDISELLAAADSAAADGAAADGAAADSGEPTSPADSGEPTASLAEIRQALGETRFAQLPAPGAEETLLKLLVQQVDGELILNATARDANRVPLSELEALLHGTESLLVAAASGDVPLSLLGEVTGVQPIDRGPGWLRVGPSWIELAQVRRLVEDALPAAAAFVIPPAAAGEEAAAGEPATGEPDADISPRVHHESELVAYLAAGGGIDTPELAHAACMATLAGTRGLAPPDGIRYTAMAPGRYVICARAPEDVRDLAGWQRQAVVAEGAGRRSLRLAALAPARFSAVIRYRGEDPVPEPDPPRERGVDRLLALTPLPGIVSAQVGEHLHGHGSVLFAVHLNMAFQVIHKGRQPVSSSVVYFHNLVEHVGNQVLPAEGEGRGLAVHRRRLYEFPCHAAEFGRGVGDLCLLQRGAHGHVPSQERDEGLDRGPVRARLHHAVKVKFEMADELAAEFVALFDEHDVVNQPAAARVRCGHPGDLDARQAALQGL